MSTVLSQDSIFYTLPHWYIDLTVIPQTELQIALVSLAANCHLVFSHRAKNTLQISHKETVGQVATKIDFQKPGYLYLGVFIPNESVSNLSNCTVSRGSLQRTPHIQLFMVEQ